MRRAGERLGLTQEGDLGLAIARALVPVQDLDRELAVELGIVGGVDPAHAAAADLLQEQVAAETTAQRRGLVRGFGSLCAGRAGRRGHGRKHACDR